MPLERQYNLYRVSEAGTLEGLRPPSQKSFELTPYVLGQTGRGGSVSNQTNSEGDFGLDAKYLITPSLTLDATYNTDFAQVEADEVQVNLNRFSIFLPEKRPFFLRMLVSSPWARQEKLNYFLAEESGSALRHSATDSGRTQAIRQSCGGDQHRAPSYAN